MVIAQQKVMQVVIAQQKVMQQRAVSSVKFTNFTEFKEGMTAGDIEIVNRIIFDATLKHQDMAEVRCALLTWLGA